nr:type II secretion system protein [Microbacterium bovistercoris]
MIEADKARKENGEAGFSLIELIIVVVILGILAAIAIPIFANIQRQAKDSAAQTAAANGATQAATLVSTKADAIAAGETAAFAKLVKGDVTGVTLTKYDPTDIGTICVTATVNGGTAASWTAGPGASADGKTCP